jgi:hypothetical protein
MVHKGKQEVLALCDTEVTGLRLMGGVELCYASRGLGKGQLTMAGIIFSLKHDWRFVDSEALDLKTLSQEMEVKAA